MSEIKRIEQGKIMSNAVVHNGVVYLAGQVGESGASATEQTKQILLKIDRLLALAGTDKTRVLKAIVWLSDMKYFADMNAVWEDWVAPNAVPARATGEAKLAAPEYFVEIIITAAV